MGSPGSICFFKNLPIMGRVINHGGNAGLGTVATLLIIAGLIVLVEMWTGGFNILQGGLRGI